MHDRRVKTFRGAGTSTVGAKAANPTGLVVGTRVLPEIDYKKSHLMIYKNSKLEVFLHGTYLY